MKKLLLLFFLFQKFTIHAQESCAKKIVTPTLTDSTRKSFEQKLALAEADYRKDSLNADYIIWYGRRTAYLGKYMEAIELFSKGIARHPNDARMYRHRAHRYITIRCFDKAIIDLEKAALLIKGMRDEVEPDGMPNAQNIPTSTLQSNIWYHLGLAYFLKGDHKRANMAYEKCLAVSTNDDMFIATANWYYLSLLKIGKIENAEKLYSRINKNANIIENFDYWKLLSGIYAKKPAETEIDSLFANLTSGSSSLGNATISFGVGFYCLTREFTEKAKAYFEKAIATGSWSSFGYIAAEQLLEL